MSNQVSQREISDTSVACVVICPSYHGQSVARSLGRLGISVYGVHGDYRSPAACSRYWRQNFFRDLSKASEKASVDWFLRLARKIGSPPVLIPTDDQSCLFVDDNAEALHQEYLFPKQPVGLSHSLLNKQQMYFLCKEKSIPTPETIFPKSREDIIRFIKEAKFPLVLKGIDTVALQHRFGVRMVIAKDAETLLYWYDKMEASDSTNIMLQEYISGGDDEVWLFNGYFDNESNCLFGMTGRKLRQHPAYMGITSLGVCERNEAVLELTKSFMKSIGYRGVIDIDYKYHAKTKKYYLLDPNPRTGSSFRIFVDSNGMDVVRALYLHLTGQNLKLGFFQEGRKWLMESYDIKSSLRYWRDGNLSLLNYWRSLNGVKEAQWFALDDLRPFGKACLNSFKQVLENLLIKT